MHPRCPITCREAKDGVGNRKFMLSTKLQEEEAITVTLSDAILPNYVLPCFVVRAHTGIKVTKYNKLIRLWDRESRSS